MVIGLMGSRYLLFGYPPGYEEFERSMSGKLLGPVLDKSSWDLYELHQGPRATKHSHHSVPKFRGPRSLGLRFARGFDARVGALVASY